uniref:Protein kinase domain-containing protein n=1 Tax=Heterorhabditis bacteriophora TaxID=37862 RepID=A0A1I7X1P2_HETBA
MLAVAELGLLECQCSDFTLLDEPLLAREAFDPLDERSDLKYIKSAWSFFVSLYAAMLMMSQTI